MNFKGQTVLGSASREWAALTRFLDDGVIAIDKGVGEHLRVRTALVRKNSLSTGSARSHRLRRAEYMRPHDINPLEYLADLLPRLARRI